MNDILTAEQVADMLRCTPETVREKTPHVIPGAKFGREMVVKAVERESMVVRVIPLCATKPVAVGVRELTKAGPPSLTP